MKLMDVNYKTTNGTDNRLMASSSKNDLVITHIYD